MTRDWRNHLIKERWESLYASLTEEKKRKIDELMGNTPQLKVIKRKRKYPEVGDIFELMTQEGIVFNGLVVNNHLTQIWPGDELILVFIFKEGIDVKNCITNGVKKDDLLIAPRIVGKEYWTRGYFHTVDHVEEYSAKKNYGFYWIPYNPTNHDTFYDEYKNELEKEPELLGQWGVVTITGIASSVYKAMIIEGMI